LRAVHAVGEAAQGVCERAHGGDGFAADIGHDSVIDVANGMAQFHLDEFHSFFDASADTAGGAGWRWIGTHASNLVQVTPDVLESSVLRLVSLVNSTNGQGAAMVTVRYLSYGTAEQE
jgi:hypothetical protein